MAVMSPTSAANMSVSQIFRMAKYSPHRAQAQVHADGTRNRVIAAGRRFGKSEIGGGELNIEAARTQLMRNRLEAEGKRREFWIVGPEYTDAEKEFRKHYDALVRTGAPLDKPGTYYDPHAGDLQISMFKGRYLVIGKSAKHPERLVGEGLSGVIMAEAAKQRERTWTKFIRPTLADYNGWSIHSSTPEGKNWFYDLWKRGQDPYDLSWQSWRFGSWDNPFVYPQGAPAEGIAMLREAINTGARMTQRLRNDSKVDPEIIEFMLDLSEETFNQEIAADFTEYAGRVFKAFDEEEHVADIEFNPALKTYAACDYGFTNPFVWLVIQEDHNGNIFVIDELYESGLSIDDAARKIDARGLNHTNMITFFPDPASPGDTLALERHLRLRATGGTGGELNIRLRYIREALKFRNTQLPYGHELRRPKLMFSRRCVNTIREMQDYRYPDTSKDSARNPKDKPLDKDDHAPEALGRFFRGRFGDPAASQTGAGARVAGTNLSSRRRTRRSL